MSVDDVVKLVDSCTKLVGSLAWPLLVGVIFIKFGPSFKVFFESLGEISVKAPGFEASATRKKAEASVALAAATTLRAEPGATPETNARDVKEAADLVAEIVTPRVLRRAERSTVLWVDDRPENNVYERHALEALGAKFILAKSTEEALDKLKSAHVDAIISDMGRPPDPRAGYTLLSKLRESGDTTPFVIYAGSNAPKHKAEARKNGALGSTNRAPELFEYVLSALGRNA
jgi:CheY-like chemotaxis protein